MRRATVIHPTPDMTITEAFIIGGTRVFTRSDIQGHHLWMDDKGVICLSILTGSGAVTYVYSDYPTAKDDYNRIDDASVTVTLRGESSGAAYDRIVAVLNATTAGQLTERAVLHGR